MQIDLLFQHQTFILYTHTHTRAYVCVSVCLTKSVTTKIVFIQRMPAVWKTVFDLLGFRYLLDSLVLYKVRRELGIGKLSCINFPSREASLENQHSKPCLLCEIDH